MDTDEVKGQFTQMTGEIKHKWRQITDVTLAGGSMEKRMGKIQHRTG